MCVELLGLGEGATEAGEELKDGGVVARMERMMLMEGLQEGRELLFFCRLFQEYHSHVPEFRYVSLSYL